MDEVERDELERAGRAVRDAVAGDREPSDRVRFRARAIVRHRRMLAVGSIATAMIATSIGIGLAVRGGTGLGVHTIAPAGSTTQPTLPPSIRPTVPTTSTPREVDAAVQGMPLLAFADPSHGWRVEPLLYQAIEHTTDGGRTWTAQLKLPSVGNTVSGVVAIDDRDALALVSNGIDFSNRLMRTANGSHWQPTGGVGLPGPLGFVSFVDSNHGWGLTRYGDLVTTADAGANWQALGQPDSRSVGAVGSVCLLAPGSGFAAVGDSVYRSDDNGTTWRRQVKIPFGGGSNIALVCNGSHAAIASFDVGAGQHIGAFVRTDDGGAHWRPLTEDTSLGGTIITAPGFPGLQTRGDPTDMSADGTLAFITGCEACEPNRNWVVLATPTDRFVEGLFDGTAAVNRITLAAQAVDASHGFAEVQSIPTSGNGPRPVSLYASSDGGRTWQWRSREG